MAAGGAIGAVARYTVGGWVHGIAGWSFPWGTLTVNVVGCLGLGFVLRVMQASTATIELRTFLSIGVLGAFTTFSTFSYEAVLLLQDGEWARAAAYVVGSVVAGLAAVIAGFWLASVTLHARA